jgi:D-arabinose 5-phosphate isomerase GutQ
MAKANRGDRLARAAEVIRLEARTIEALVGRLGGNFEEAVERILGCKGLVIVTGLGKAGLVGAKISATLASTGTPSIALHPTEALHGDLGRIRPDDVVLVLSNSGETDEIKYLMPHVRRIGAAVIALVGAEDSALAKLADCVLDIGRVDEACPLGLAPTASTSAMMALGDALAMVVLEERGFSREDYARYHPAGALGRRLMRVSEVMRTGEEGSSPTATCGDCSRAAIPRSSNRSSASWGRPRNRCGPTRWSTRPSACCASTRSTRSPSSTRSSAPSACSTSRTSSARAPESRWRARFARKRNACSPARGSSRSTSTAR